MRAEDIKTIGIGIILAVVVYFIFKSSKKKYYLSRSLQKIDVMSGIHFEHYLAYQFRKLGYRVKVTPPSGDFGADLIIRKWGRKAVVQAKRYQGSVGIKAVQEAIGAREYYKAKQAIVITNSYYTSAAIKLAKASNVVLWDRGHMIEEFGLVEYKHQKELHCPICQSPLVVRNGKFGEFYGCTNYPNCSYTKNID